MIETAITRAWNLKYPIVQAPMAGVAGAELAAAVSAAGGLGMLGVGSATATDWIAEQAERVRPHGPFGIGLMVWAVERRPELLEAAVAARPAAIALSFGDPAPFVPRVHAAGIRVASLVQSAARAQEAVAAGVDVLVAQGTEAGGHTGAVGTLPLLQAVLPIGEATGLPVLAAGGIGTGRGIAGVLAMGTAGAWIGTRFAATAEALGSEAAKRAIVAADETQTVHTHVFDIVQRIPWPEPFPGRALRNAFTARWHGHERELEQQLDAVQPAFEAARARGDLAEANVYAGQASGLVDDLPRAGELLRRLMAEAEATLRRTALAAV